MVRQIALLSGLMLLPCPTQAQAPPWTDLWRVASGTLTEPAALATGPAATFWNAAAVMGPSRIAGGVEVYQIPDAVNVSGVLLGANYRMGKTLAVGAIAGRLAVGDLVRTSTSPASAGSDIEVYSQFAGGTVGTQTGPLALGTTLLVYHGFLMSLFTVNY